MAFILGAKDVLVCVGNQYSEISCIFWKLLKESAVAKGYCKQNYNAKQHKPVHFSAKNKRENSKEKSGVFSKFLKQNAVAKG